MTTLTVITIIGLFVAALLAAIDSKVQRNKNINLTVDVEGLRYKLDKANKCLTQRSHQHAFLSGQCLSADHTWVVEKTTHGAYVLTSERDEKGLEYRIFAKYFHADTPDDLDYARNCAEELCDKLNEKI